MLGLPDSKPTLALRCREREPSTSSEMARPPLPPSEPAAPETIAEHRRIGRRWISKAQEAHPGLLPEGALAQVQANSGDLDASTVGRYRADLKYGLLENMTLAGRLDHFPSAWAKVNEALTKRRAIIAKKNKRTSALKIKDATEAEAKELFDELKKHALSHGNPNAILACLFTLIAGHCGFRPVELRGARLVGTTLTLPNAKKRPGHEPTRSMSLVGLHGDVLIGIELMLGLIDHDLSKAEFAKWQKVLAQQIRRACIRRDIRKLSLYSFRHVTIASWAAAGLSVQEIAQLCGHLSIRTAHQHYARSDVGHKRKAVARAVPSAPLEAAAPMDRPDEAAQNHTPADRGMQLGAGPHPAPIGFYEDLPQPVQRPDKRATMPAAEARRRLEEPIDPRNPAEIARNIRVAREAREAREVALDLKRTD